MINQFKLANSLGAYPPNMAFFNPPVTDIGTNDCEIIAHSIQNRLDDTRVVIEITGNRNQLIDLKGITANIKAKIVNEDGTNVNAMPDGLWSPDPITGVDNETKENERKNSQNLRKTADIWPINNLYYSIFKDATMTLQGVKIFENDIAYKALFDTIVNNEFDVNKTIMTQFYVPASEKSESSQSIIMNHPKMNVDGFLLYQYTMRSNEIEMCGSLPFDICKQGKLLLSHVDLKLELIKHYSDFFLRHPHNMNRYRLKITDFKLMVPFITVSPDVEIAQAEILKDNPALYPYINKKITVHSVKNGCFFFEHINTWNGDVPSKLTILMVPSENYHGSYITDPFGFEHNYVKSAEIRVDNKIVGGKGMSLTITDDVRTSHINDAYCALIDSYPKMKLTREQWINNFPALHFNIKRTYSDDVMPQMGKGLTKVNITYDNPLAEDTIVLMIAEFPALMEIDGIRNVTV